MASSDKNVLGGSLVVCSTSPRTGFYRDGCCNTGSEDVGIHVIKTLAKGPWGEDQPKRYASWYEPFDDQPTIDQAVAFNLSLPINADLPLPAQVRKRYDHFNKLSKEAKAEQLYAGCCASVPMR